MLASDVPAHLTPFPKSVISAQRIGQMKQKLSVSERPSVFTCTRAGAGAVRKWGTWAGVSWLMKGVEIIFEEDLATSQQRSQCEQWRAAEGQGPEWQSQVWGAGAGWTPGGRPRQEAQGWWPDSRWPSHSRSSSAGSPSTAAACPQAWTFHLEAKVILWEGLVTPKPKFLRIASQESPPRCPSQDFRQSMSRCELGKVCLGLACDWCPWGWGTR